MNLSFSLSGDPEIRDEGQRGVFIPVQEKTTKAKLRASLEVRLSVIRFQNWNRMMNLSFSLSGDPEIRDEGQRGVFIPIQAKTTNNKTEGLTSSETLSNKIPELE